MDYQEELLWILDGTSKSVWDEAENERRIAFVHSLGLKCDCVGWSELDLGDARADGVLDQIEAFCKETGWSARGYYTRTSCDSHSGWYRLACGDFKDNEYIDLLRIPFPGSLDYVRMPRIKAYAVLDHSPKALSPFFFFPDRFRKGCAENRITDFRFSWLPDKGKYAGEQYFVACPQCRVPRMMRDYNYDLKQGAEGSILEAIAALGGKLTRVAEIFRDLYIMLPVCYLREDLPESGIGYAFMHQTYSTPGKSDILLRADRARELVDAGLLNPKMLAPVSVSDDPLPGYALMETEELPFPDDQMKAYEELLKKNRPQRNFTQKDSLKLLRKAKKERPEDFKSPLPKKFCEPLAQGLPDLAAWYGISDGGWLSEEYRFLPYEEAIAEGTAYSEAARKEELSQLPALGAVIAKCPDGDKVILTPVGEVCRISHEVPEITAQWKNPAQFLADAVSD